VDGLEISTLRVQPPKAAPMMGGKQIAKLIQIFASQNDLFALDAEGVVYHYNFNTTTWMRLGRGQRDHGDSPGGVDGVERHLEPT
jgi:hypothetical protein